MKASIVYGNLVFDDYTPEERQALRELFGATHAVSWGEGCIMIRPKDAPAEAVAASKQPTQCPECQGPLSTFIDADMPELSMVTCANCGYNGRKDEVMFFP